MRSVMAEVELSRIAGRVCVVGRKAPARDGAGVYRVYGAMERPYRRRFTTTGSQVIDHRQRYYRKPTDPAVTGPDPEPWREHNSRIQPSTEKYCATPANQYR